MKRYTETDESSDMEELVIINLITVQQAILKSILSFGQQTNEEDDETEIEVGEGQLVPRSLFTFKALIYDTHAQHIIASIMNKGNLRENNIIYHANIGAKREQISDLPTLYLIEPTLQNFKLVAQDAKEKLYDLQIVNFTRPVVALSDFAQQMQSSRQAHRVISVSSDFFGAFQVIGPEFFVFQNGGFGKVYSESRVASQVYVDTIAESLYCFYQTLGFGGPIIRVTDDLTRKIALKLNSIYKQNPSQGRQSLLVPWSRQDDLYTPVYHSWTYLSQIHDIFNIKNNTFVFQEEGNQQKTFEVCLQSDNILKQFGMMGFHEASEKISKSLDDWVKEYESLTKNQTSNLSNISGALTTAMDALPAMTEAKRKVDMHVNIATKLGEEIRRREIDKLQDIEDEIMKGAGLSAQTKQQIEVYLQKDGVNQEDAVRLLVILSLSGQDRKFTENLLKSVGKLKSGDVEMLRMMFEESKPVSNSQQDQGFMGRFGSSLLENLVGFGKDKKMVIVNHVKNLLNQIVNKVPLPQGQQYLNTATGQQTQTLLFLPQQVVVFACGGGTFIDYELMQGLNAELQKSSNISTQLLFGCDTIYNPNEFLSCLRQKYSS